MFPNKSIPLSPLAFHLKTSAPACSVLGYSSPPRGTGKGDEEKPELLHFFLRRGKGAHGRGSSKFASAWMKVSLLPRAGGHQEEKESGHRKRKRTRGSGLAGMLVAWGK